MEAKKQKPPVGAERICRQCGGVLPSEGWQGLCPKCLVRVSLEPVGMRSTASQSGEVTEAGERLPAIMIGRYKILQQIGEGGFGMVHMAEQTEPVQRKVALKVIKAGMDTKEVISRFETERQALALMDHPNIAQVYDAGATDSPHPASCHPLPPATTARQRAESDGRGARGKGHSALRTPHSALSSSLPYFVMELVRGIPITEYCDQASLSTRERLELFIKVCHAVQHAHQKGVIHRDLKPSNVLVALHDGEPVPKVIDFGVAKALGQKLTDKTLFTRFEQMIGTPAYMSPEQAALGGLDIDTRSDIYSLGVLLYQLLTGVTPLDTETLRKRGMDEIRRMIRETDPPKPSTRVADMVAADARRLSSKSEIQNLKSEIERRRLLHGKKELISALRGDLDWITMKALEKDRRRRYETPNALVMDIERHLHDEPVAARPPSALYKLQKVARRHRVAFATGVAVALAVVASIAMSSWQTARAGQAERHARTAQANESAEAKRAELAATNSQQAAQFLKEQLQTVASAMIHDRAQLIKILDATAQGITLEMKDQPEVQAELLDVIGRTYHIVGSYAQAEAIHREVLAFDRSTYGNESPLTINSLKSLANALIEQDRLPEAEILQREAVALSRNLPGDNQEILANSLGGLAGVLSMRFDSPWLRSQGLLAEMGDVAAEALAINRNLFGNIHVAVAGSLETMAWVTRHQGKIAEAEKMFREVLTIRMHLQGGPTAEGLGGLAVVLRDQGKAAEAEKLGWEALAILRKVFGEEHPRIADYLCDLTYSLEPQGKLAEAEAVARESLAMFRKLLDNECPGSIRALDQLAYLLQKQGRLAEAESNRREMLDLSKRVYGEDAPATDEARSALASVLEAEDRTAEAETLMRDALTRLRSSSTNNPQREAKLLNGLGNALRAQRKLPEAELSLCESLALSRKLFGEGSPETDGPLIDLAIALEDQRKAGEAEALLCNELATLRGSPTNKPRRIERLLSALANALRWQGKFTEAEAISAEALASARQFATSDPLRLRWLIVELAEALRPQNRFADAEPLYREAIEIDRRVGPDDPGKWASDSCSLAFVLRSQKKYSEAESLLLESNEELEQNKSAEPRLKRETLEGLVQLYEAWELDAPNTGKAAKGAEWKKKLK